VVWLTKPTSAELLGIAVRRGDLVGDRAHHGLDTGGEGRVGVAGVQRHHVAVGVVVAPEQVLRDVGAGARRLAVQQLADRGDRRRHGFGVARGILGVEDHRADDAHDELALLVVEVGAGALQRLPGQIADEGRLVADVGVP
jgi:hypothetical protein